MCTPWSTIGSQEGWAASAAVSFFVWAKQVLGLRPEFIVHECTPLFEWQILEEIFGHDYEVLSFCLCPRDLGIPASRKRRWTLLILKSFGDFGLRGRGNATLAASFFVWHVYELPFVPASSLGGACRPRADVSSQPRLALE
eukprot:7158356-Alexandrium_andersonii.AAC.1